MDNFKSFQGIGWVGQVATKNPRYAQAMGFKYVYHDVDDNPDSDMDYEKSNEYKTT